MQKDILTDVSSADMGDPNTDLLFPFFWFARRGLVSNEALPLWTVTSCTIAGSIHAVDCSPTTGLEVSENFIGDMHTS
jgi:hypothetical protein